MTDKNAPPLWCLIHQQDNLADITTQQISEILNLIAKQLEVRYGPSIYSWALYLEATNAERVWKDQLSRVNQQSELDAFPV